MANVSVIMPMRNAENFVRAAVQSILNQHGVDLELIIVDDGSTDRSRQVVSAISDPRIRIIDGPRRGIAAALNSGIAAATGEYLSRCDADDFVPPGRFARQVAFLESHPEFGAVAGQFCTTTPDGRILAEMDCGNEEREITHDLQHGRICTSACTLLIRTDLARAVGLREAFVSAEDLDFFLRLAESTRIYFEPHVEYHYRLHDASLTHSQPCAAREYFEAMSRQLQQERRATGRDRLMRGETLNPPRGNGKVKTSSSHVQAVLMGAAWRYFRNGDRPRAVLTGIRLCARRPTAPGSWRNLAALMLKRSAG